mmetsp:Transcript_23099/g.47003  ORF Transcript_23099/g.47003 Transcript_23099/m.47003 type:complete len:496 (-) Transcript_23099:194-1681(-)
MKFHFRHDTSSSSSSAANHHDAVLVVSQPVQSSSLSSSGRPSRRRRKGRGFRSPAKASRRTNDDGIESDGGAPAENSLEIANSDSNRGGPVPSQAAPPSPAVNPVLTAKWSVPRPPSNPAASDDEDAERGHESDYSDCGATSDEDNGGMSVVVSSPPKRQFFRLVGRPRSASKGGSSGTAGGGSSESVAGVAAVQPVVSSGHSSTALVASTTSGAATAWNSNDDGTKKTVSPLKPRGMGLLKPTLRRTVSLPVSSSQCNGSSSSEKYQEDDGHKTSSSTAFTVGASITGSDCSDPKNSTKKVHRRHVTFTTIQVRQYSRILGDHPCCPSGPPLSLGWDMERQDTFSLEFYEKEREPERRSNKEGMRLNCELRREILESLTMVVPPLDCSGSGADGEGSSSACHAAPHDTAATTEATPSAPATCCVYTKAELRRAERRLEKERAGNHRVHRKMNKCFFRPLTEEERKRMDCTSAMDVSENSDANPTEGSVTTKEEP